MCTSPPRNLSGVCPCADQVQRYVWFIADHLAVVSWRHIEDVASVELDDTSVGHGHSGASPNHDPDMFDVTGLLAERAADMVGPLPSRFIGRAAERHAGDADDLERPSVKPSYFVRIVEPFYDHIHDGTSVFRIRDQGATQPFAKSWRILLRKAVAHDFSRELGSGNGRGQDSTRPRPAGGVSWKRRERAR